MMHGGKMTILLDTLKVLKAELQDVYKLAGINDSTEDVKRYLEKRVFTLEREIDMDKRNYSKKFEDWIDKQPTREANGLSISDTVTRSKDGEES